MAAPDKFSYLAWLKYSHAVKHRNRPELSTAVVEYAVENWHQVVGLCLLRAEIDDPLVRWLPPR